MIFLRPKVNRPSTMVCILSALENSENRYKDVTSPTSQYQRSVKGVRYSSHCTKNEVFYKDFFSKRDQILRKLRILNGKLQFLCSE